MKPYEHGNMVVLAGYRAYRGTRQRLILEWKNKLVRLSPAQFTAEKFALAQALRTSPESFELGMKWQMLMEIEQG